MFCNQQKLDQGESSHYLQQLFSSPQILELKTPLNLISSGLKSIENQLRLIFDKIQFAQDNDSLSQNLLWQAPETHALITRIMQQTYAHIHFVDMQLKYLQAPNIENLHSFSISHLLEKAIHAYPFHDHELKIIKIKLDADFYVLTDSLLLKHVFWNLIKFSLDCISTQQNGYLIIESMLGKNKNILHFKIISDDFSSAELEALFESKNNMDLLFCKKALAALAGIFTYRFENNYIEFSIKFSV